MKANHLHVIGLLHLFSLGHFWATFRVFAPTAPPRRHFHRAPIRLKAYRPAESSLVGRRGSGASGRADYLIDRAPQNKFCRDAFPVWMPTTPPPTSRGLFHAPRAERTPANAAQSAFGRSSPTHRLLVVSLEQRFLIGRDQHRRPCIVPLRWAPPALRFPFSLRPGLRD